MVPRPVKTRFRSGSVFLLNLARHGNSPVHSTKGTPSPLNGLRLLVGIRFQVLFHSPPGFFSPFPHGTRPLSVTCSYLGLPDGAASGWVPRAPPYSGTPLLPLPRFAYGALTLFAGRSMPFRASVLLLRSYYPSPWAGLASSGFARRYSRNHFCSLFLRVLDVSLPPGSPPFRDASPLRDAGFPIRTSPDPRSPTAPPARFAVGMRPSSPARA